MYQIMHLKKILKSRKNFWIFLDNKLTDDTVDCFDHFDHSSCQQYKIFLKQFLVLGEFFNANLEFFEKHDDVSC